LGANWRQCPGAPVRAQELGAGQRIRVTAPDLHLDRQVGELLRLDRDSLVLGSNGQHWAVPPSLVSQVDVSGGQRGHEVTGLVIGAVAGLGMGFILFSPGSTGCTGSGDYGENCAYYRAASAVGGAGLGALIGALIHTERWVPFPLGSVRFGTPTP
jgi:hypothetical protein